MSTTNIAESIFDSIALIVEKRIANLDYDKTLICTITDISKATQENLYTVTDGSVSFEAQGDGTTYQVNDQVRVLIVNGDMTKEKYIQGKHSSTGETVKPITYVSPLDSVLKVTDNLLSNDTYTTTFGIAANGGHDEILITNIQFTEDDVQNSDIFDTLYLSAEFQTNFDQYKMYSGDYGLHLKLITELIDDDGKTTHDAYGLYFSAKSNMFGNPYTFKIFTLQEIKYSLSQWPENVVGLQIYLYQDGQFKYYDDSAWMNPPVTYQPQTISGSTLNDIRVKNISIGFGSKVSAEESSKVKLYTNDLQTYHSDDTIVDTKKLQLLWYNRNESNEYLGFSDGIFDLTYDEDNYLNVVSKNTRLLSRQSELYPKDQISLSLLADMYDIKNYANTAANLISVDLHQIIEGFKSYTFGIGWGDLDPFNTMTTEVLGQAAQDIINAATALNNVYDNILQCANKNANVTLNLPADTTIEELHSIVKTLINNIITKITTLLNTVAGAVGTTENPGTYAAYRDVYNTYLVRLTKITDKLSDIVNNINALMVADTNLIQPDLEKPDPAITLLSTKTNTQILTQIKTFIETPTATENILDLSKYIAYNDITKTPEFQSNYNNKYCIYWYRYDKEYLNADAHMPQGWERLTQYNNYGLPAEADENNKFVKKANTTDSTKKGFVSLNLREKDEEKFVVVLFYNHIKFKSNELIFDNLTPIPNVPAMDANGALTIEHKTSSQDAYQLYGATGMLLNAADRQVKRELRARFNGAAGADEQLIGATIYWYVPQTATMLEIVDLDVRNKFHDDRVTIYSDLASLNNAYSRKQLLSNRTNVVLIDTVYKYCSVNDNYETYAKDVNCIISDTNVENKDRTKTYLIKSSDYIYEVFSDTTPEAEEPTWTKAEQTVSKYVFTDASTKVYNNVESIPEDADTTKEYLIGPPEGPFTAYKFTNDEWIATGYKINDLTPALISSSIYKQGYNCYHKQIGINEAQDSETQTLKVDDTIFPYHIKDYYQQTATQNTILCVIEKGNMKYQTSQTFTFSAYGTNGTDYTLTLTSETARPMVVGQADALPLSVKISLYDYDQKALDLPATPSVTLVGPTGYECELMSNHKDIQIKQTIQNVYAGILKCAINSFEIENERKINLTTQIPIPYGNTENYYIEGVDSIIYDSNGGNPQYYKKPYVLYSKIDGNAVSDVTWSLEYYKGTSTTPFTATKTVNEDKVVSYTLNGSAAGVTEINSYSLNYLPYLTSGNILVPSPMYLTYAEEEQCIYPVAIAKNAAGTVLWAQPILIYQNAYSSSILNEWDGGLSIDKENGTILSTMVGAGRKNKDNKFEGVLMGDVGTGSGDDAIITTGLYGFHEGAQSFGFKVDGTAFLGKSGRGRIDFNGNSGSIVSGNYYTKNAQQELVKNNQGMLIDLDDGTIDAYNFSLKGEVSKGVYAGSYLLLNSDPEKNFIEACYKEPGSGINLKTLEIGKNTYILRSSNWTESTGMKIDLMDGSIVAHYQEAAADSPINEIRLDCGIGDSEANYPLLIGDNSNYPFRILWDGSLQIGPARQFKVDSSTGNLTTSGTIEASGQVTIKNALKVNGGSDTLSEITSPIQFTSSVLMESLEVNGTVEATTVDATLLKGEGNFTKSTIKTLEVTEKAEFTPCIQAQSGINVQGAVTANTYNVRDAQGQSTSGMTTDKLVFDVPWDLTNTVQLIFNNGLLTSWQYGGKKGEGSAISSSAMDEKLKSYLLISNFTKDNIESKFTSGFTPAAHGSEKHDAALNNTIETAYDTATNNASEISQIKSVMGISKTETDDTTTSSVVYELRLSISQLQSSIVQLTERIEGLEKKQNNSSNAEQDEIETPEPTK